jgi:parallel beta-helix repeat protein
VTLLGAGASSILRTTDSTVINIIEVDTQEYITIEKLAFDGNIGNNPYDGSYIVQCGIYLKECFRVNVINCNFSHMPSSGICSYTTVAPSKGCTIIDCTFKEMDGHAGAAGIEFIDKAEYNKVSECEFVNCKYGIRLGTSNNVVSNCVINEPATSMQSYGIYVGSSYNKIIGCSINHIDGDAAIYIAANDVRIIGCEFLVNQRHGIKINGNRNNNIISECSFFANSFQGLNLYSDIWLGGGAVNGTIISNNIFSGYTGGNKPKYAIDENHASVDYTLISGNIFRNNYGTGMRNIQGANTIVVDNLDMP